MKVISLLDGLLYVRTKIVGGKDVLSLILWLNVMVRNLNRIQIMSFVN